MVVTELSPEQIIGLLTGIGGAVAVIITAARQSAKGGEGPVERINNAGGPALLVLDAKQVQNLADQMGLLISALTINQAALTRNSDVCERVLRGMDETQEDLRAMTLELARNSRGR